MGSLILMSMIIATVAIPALAARDPLPRRALRRMLVVFFLFSAGYLSVLLLVYARWFVPEWFG